MRYYETLYLLNPDLSEDDYNSEIAKFNDIIEKNSGELIKIDEWGRRPLAYQVKKFDRGFYVLLNFCGDGSLLAEIERAFKLDERVLKSQTLKLSDHADVEALRAATARQAPEAEADEDSLEAGDHVEETTGDEIADEEPTDEDREEG